LAYVSSAQDPVLGAVLLTSYTTGFIAPLLIAATATVSVKGFVMVGIDCSLGSFIADFIISTILELDLTSKWSLIDFWWNLCTPNKNRQCLTIHCIPKKILIL